MQDSAQSAVVQDIYDYSKTQVMTFVCISLPDHSPLVFGNVGRARALASREAFNNFATSFANRRFASGE